MSTNFLTYKTTLGNSKFTVTCSVNRWAFLLNLCVPNSIKLHNATYVQIILFKSSRKQSYKVVVGFLLLYFIGKNLSPQ